MPRELPSQPQEHNYAPAYSEAASQRLDAETAAVREATMARAAHLGEQFPQIADALREHAERVCRDLDAMRVPGQPRISLDELADKEKRDYWELLSILARAVPDLPIAQMHDEGAAMIDLLAREGKAQKEALQGATKTTKSTMGDVAIDHHISGNDRSGE